MGRSTPELNTAQGRSIVSKGRRLEVQITHSLLPLHFDLNRSRFFARMHQTVLRQTARGIWQRGKYDLSRGVYPSSWSVDIAYELPDLGLVHRRSGDLTAQPS